eukprot:gnl/MRDRNA2_/MRDRNA2_61314_c0_seq1.p1 gnl/MRDRNA2_/MRDRNA2_61314_c0~~gnl/MRDRNA2_/MRDRNA2_61314_c0_seq1.p1  ORF type:complete len:691 (+),score=122.19 gnl/MRDRNA2_/MRDRNA2_61314_c0_seq1:47-2074(+)
MSAAPCSYDQYGRPMTGNIDVCYGKTKKMVQKHGFEPLADTLFHETIHAMGFNPGSIMNMRQSDGKTKHPEHVKSVGGKKYLVTPKIMEFMKEHFGCDAESIGIGAALDAGMAHWHPRVFFGDVQTPESYGVIHVVSGATLAFLEDTGWYQVRTEVKEHAESLFVWGKKQGCDFIDLSKKCIEDKQTKFPTHFCLQGYEWPNPHEKATSACMPDRRYKGRCTLDGVSRPDLDLPWDKNLKPKADYAIPEEFRYFVNFPPSGRTLKDIELDYNIADDHSLKLGGILEYDNGMVKITALKEFDEADRITFIGGWNRDGGVRWGKKIKVGDVIQQLQFGSGYKQTEDDPAKIKYLLENSAAMIELLESDNLVVKLVILRSTGQKTYQWGGSKYMDFCPTYAPSENGDCTDGESGLGAAEVRGPDSRCVEAQQVNGGLIPLCVRRQCIRDTESGKFTAVIFTMGRKDDRLTSVTCAKEEWNVAKDVPGRDLRLVCGHLEEYCYDDVHAVEFQEHESKEERKESQGTLNVTQARRMLADMENKKRLQRREELAATRKAYAHRTIVRRPRQKVNMMQARPHMADMESEERLQKEKELEPAREPVAYNSGCCQVNEKLLTRTYDRAVRPKAREVWKSKCDSDENTGKEACEASFTKKSLELGIRMGIRSFKICLWKTTGCPH